MPLITFSGLASGIDAEALISATSDATRSTRVRPLENRITSLTETNAALEQLKTKLTSMQTLLNTFKTSSGGPLVKSASSSDESHITATATNAASNGTFTVTVTDLAKSAAWSFDQNFGDPTEPVAPGLVSTGNDKVTITIGTGSNLQTVEITLTESTTASDIVTTFNNATTKAVASLVNVGTAAAPAYRINFSGNFEGTDKGDMSVAVGTDITAVGALTAHTLNASTDAKDATFTVTGISGTITKSTNSVTDVIPGVTINLKEAASTATITISDDKSGTSTKVQNFVNSYNEIIKFINENNLITRQENARGVENVFSPLASTRVDDNAMQSIRSAMVLSVYESGNALQEVKIFADLGVTTERDGTLKFDSAKLSDAISKEAASVNQILKNFGDRTAAAGGIIDQQIGFNRIIPNAITGNKNLIDETNKRIAQYEASIARSEESMRLRFSRLEATIGRLKNQQTALTSALSSLGFGSS